MLEEFGMAAAAAGRGVSGEQRNRGEVPDSSEEGGKNSRQTPQTQLSSTNLGG